MARADIYIYGKIGGEDGYTAKDFLFQASGFAEGDVLDVHIHSEGGSIFEAFAIYRQMRNSQATFNCYIEGVAGSAGSIIALGGDKLLVADGSLMMLHSVRFANKTQLTEEDLNLLETINGEMMGIYTKRTQMSEEQLAEYIDAKDGKDFWLTSKALIEMGIADEVNENKSKIVAMLNDSIELINKGETMTVENTKEEVKAEAEKVETFTKEEVQEQIKAALDERKEFEAKIDGLSLHEDQKELLASIKEEEGMTLEKAQGLVIADFQENQGKYTTVQLNKDTLVNEAPEAVEVVAEVEEKVEEPSKDELKAQWTTLKAQGKFKEAAEVYKQFKNLK